MEVSPTPARAKRGCLWYVGVAVAGVFGLFVLFVAALFFSPSMPSQPYILISAADQTYLEAVTENHGEGFLDGYNWLAIYYVHVGGWFQDTQRVQVYNNPHDTANDVKFQRSTDLHGHPQIVVTHYTKQDSITAFVFTVPKDFDEFSAQRQRH
jgi:hypothetical protein